MCALLARHVERAADGRGRLGHIERIHEQRFDQLTRCAGKSAQDQHAVIVIARGHEFLGDQVHAVVQAVDDAEIGGAIELEHLLRILMLADQYDRLPIGGGEARVDALHFGHCGLLQCPVGRKLAARGRGDLQQRHATMQARVLLQQQLERQEAFEQSLGEIPAFDTQSQ